MDKKIFATIISIFVLAIIVFALYTSGSPFQARLEKIDRSRIDNLKRVSYEIENYYRQNDQLPESLDKLKTIEPEILTDPKTKEKYDYEKTNTTTYKLCANFATKSKDDRYRYGPSPQQDWSHSKGNHCFDRNIDNLKNNTPRPRVEPSE